jgi:hypothetical protein
MTDREKFSLSIAGLGVEVNCSHKALAEVLAKRYAAFPANGEIHLHADVQWNGKERESALLDTGTRFQGCILKFEAPGYQGWIDEHEGQARLNISSNQPVEEIDYFLRVVYALLAFKSGGLLFHSAGIVHQGMAYLFFGHSGSGKTTVSQLSSNDVVLNDDLLLLLKKGEGWYAFGTPFWNPTQTSPTATSAPIKKMLRLVQDTEVSLNPLPAGKAIAELISNVPVLPLDPDRSASLLLQLQQIRKVIPVYELHFLPDASFWSLIAPGETFG